MLTPLFDRFDARDADGGSLARDLEDLLGARRAASAADEGILGWGVPIPPGLSPLVELHRERVAALIAEAIARHEPRLDDVRVAPVPGVGEFLYEIEGKTYVDGWSTLRLRVLVPRRDGGLGARVLELSRVPRPAAAGGGNARPAGGGERIRPVAGGT